MAKAPCNEQSCIQVTNIVRMEGKLDIALEKIEHIDNKLENKYSTKEEVTNLTRRLEIIESILSKITWIVVTAIIVAVLALIIKT